MSIKHTVFTLHTTNLLDDIIPNAAPDGINNGGFNFGLNCLKGYLELIAERAIELEDDELNALMCRMTLYSCADESSPDYNPEGVKELYKKVGFKQLKGTINEH